MQLTINYRTVDVIAIISRFLKISLCTIAVIFIISNHRRIISIRESNQCTTDGWISFLLRSNFHGSLFIECRLLEYHERGMMSTVH